MLSFPSVSSFTDVLGHLLPEPHAGLLAGILFGTKATLSPALKNALVNSGVIHLIALSGQNIAIVVGVVSPFLVFVFSRRIASLLTILVLVGYVAFVGVSPSVVRAAIMGSLTLCAVIWGRLSWSLLVWILAVGGMLLINPSWVGDVGFQLSAFASLGIILFGGRKNRKPWLLSLIEDDLRVTLSAQSLTIPIILWHFQRLSIVAPLTNLLVGWTMLPLMMFGWLAVFFGWLFLPAGHVFAWMCWVLLEWMVRVVLFFNTIPFASIGF